jgi:CheY-like chemotaxis protein
MPAPMLIAEDSDDDILLFQMALKKSSFTQPCHFVRNGVEAMNWLKGLGAHSDRQKFPLPVILITDLKMPKMDGFELLEWVRSESCVLKIPVIVYSSSGDPKDIEKAYGLGATTYFQKTSNFSDVIRFIKTMPLPK